MNVLLVLAEDQAVCASLRAALPAESIVLVEPSIEGARRRMLHLQPDVIVLDDAPRLGAHVLSALKENAGSVPVLALSSRGDLLSQAALTRAGADGVLVKPFSHEALCTEVAQLSQRPTQAHPEPGPVEPEYGRRSLNQHQLALRWLSRASLNSEDPIRLARSLVEASGDIFDAVRCAVLLERDGAVRVVASHGVPSSITESLRLNYSRGLMRWFDEFACLIDPATVSRAPEAVKELQLLNARLAAPLLREGRVYGAIVLGDKASGVGHSPEERELLMLVARCAAIAFERAQSMQDAAQQHDRLDTVFAHLPAGVVSVGADRCITRMNAEAEHLLQVRSLDAVGRSVQKLGSMFADVVLRTLEDGQARTGEKVHDPGLASRLNLSVTPLVGDGAIAVLMCAPEEHVQTEDIAYSPFWEYLASRVAQEIKNPMVAINTFAQLLPRKYDSVDFRDAFSRVVLQEVGRINHVVETLFEFARNPKLAFQRCNLNETLKNILKSFEDELETHAIELKAEWDPQVEEAEIDPVYFSQAVQNVVQNSIDAMPTGGVLSITTRQQEDQMEISISDTGPGIGQDDPSLIFLPFYSSREKGMGLGLSIANRIIRQHHGELQLAPGNTTGACFILHLPAAQVQSEDESFDPHLQISGANG